MEHFDIPIVLIIFKRYDTVLRIIDRIREVKPQKMYILGDGGRNPEEIARVNNTREMIETAIDWPCEVVKNYAEKNRGVHANIGLGAKWVFDHEEQAIFLEDDNLPELTFFYYCKELLEKYRDNTNILWICGTNYLAKYYPENGASYMFTQHLLPCGWASWSNKFNKFYDDELLLANDPYIIRNMRATYYDKKLYKQQINSILNEKRKRDSGRRYASWDFHMALSIRAHNLLGISPAHNQIKNIGADEDSTHGGSDINNIMTKRFCGMESHPLPMPLKHPKTLLIDEDYEWKLSNIILLPLRYRLKGHLIKMLKKLLRIPLDDSLSRALCLGRKR